MSELRNEVHKCVPNHEVAQLRNAVLMRVLAIGLMILYQFCTKLTSDNKA